MTIEDFKDVYKDKTPLEKLKLLIVQTDYIRDDVRSMERDRINGNEKGADYMRSEIRAKEERIQWLYDQLAPVLKAQEAGRDFVDRGMVIDAVNQLVKKPGRPEMICSTDVIEAVAELPAVKLEAQEPRVMTLEEVNALDWDYCYLEQERLPGKEYRGLLGKYIMTCVTWPSITAAKISQGKDNYGRTWRCWTSRPTDAQREAVKWDD